MQFRLHVLGTASAKPMTDRFSSAQVLDVRGRLILIDCGEGTQMRMARQHLSYLKIDIICISHIHGDHIFGLYGLLSTMGLYGRKSTLNIYGPKALGPIINFFMSYYGGYISYKINFHPISSNEPILIHDDKRFVIYALPLRHGVEDYGYLVKEKEPELNVKKSSIEKYNLSLAEIAKIKRGEDIEREDVLIPNSELSYMPFKPRSYAYCSDTLSFPELADWVSGVDLLYHESTYLKDSESDAIKRFHSTAEQAALCAKNAKVGKLLLGHYSSRYHDKTPLLAEARAEFPESYLTNDCDVFEVNLNKNSEE